MGCVNKSSKEFKDIAARNNLADNTLELITHKYWLETGNETLFPTDVYIQAQLGNSHYQESGKSVRELWRKMYNTPQEFKSLSQLQVARKEASRFFPQSAIVHYRNAKGNYVLSVKRPVEQANYDKDDFFDEFDNIGSMRDVKKLNLGIRENQTYTISKVQELYNRFNEDRTSKALADKVFSIAKDLGIEVSFNETLPFGTIGRYTNSNTITYKKSFLERDIMTNKKASIILHEVLHSISMYALSNQTKNWKRPEALQKFRTEINSLYQDLKNNPLLKGERGVVDVFEFVAELANPVFRDKIQEIDKQSKANKSFWSRILDAFKSLLGIHTSDTYYQRSINALDKALNAFDIDTYMRYNGIKSSLRQGYNAKEWEFNSMSDKELKSKVNDYFDSKIYNEELLSLKKKAIADGTFMKAPNGRPTNLTERQWLQVRTKAFKDWFGNWETNPSEASKIVDENGEPLVVYHGTNADNITAFSLEKAKHNTGIFLSKSKNVARSYVDWLNIDYYGKINNYELDNFDIYESYDEYKSRILESEKDADLPFSSLISEEAFNAKKAAIINFNEHVYNTFVNLRNPLIVDAKKRKWDSILFKGIRNTTESLAVYAKKYGYDGVVVTDVEDNGLKNQNDIISGSEISDEYIAFNPNQIKSATDNVGSFYTDNDEIYNYEIDNSNINDQLSDNEKKDILREIKAINEAKRSLIDVGGDSLYIVDHTDKDGLNHLKNDQEGFLVKEIINIKGLSKEEINNIKEWYAKEGIRGTIQATDRWLERNGYRGSYYSSDSFDAKDRKANNNNAGLDNQASQGKARRGQSSQNSQADFSGSQIKTGYDGTNHPRYMDAEAAKEFINNMSDNELKDELSLIEQESADYNLVNNIPENNKHSGKPIPQDFTFADGTKIKAPFKPNAQQIDALNEMDRFMKSNETSMTLSGYAGTGKTSLMEMIAQKGRKQHRPVVFCASTNKAAAVLNERVSKAGFKAATLNKVFGISVEVDSNSNTYNARNLVNVLKDADITPGTTVIIDEASMINEENYDILNNIAKQNSLKIIYVGDSAQLAPVNENKISKVFRNGEGKVITLTQVERTDDNAILKEATELRNGNHLSGISSFNNKGEGVAYISPNHQDEINNVVAHYVKGLKHNPNYFRILAYTNKAVSAYNNQVRELLGYISPTPNIGEPMTGYTNWGYNWKTKSYRFINSESYKVSKIDKPHKITTSLNDGTAVTMEAIPLTLEDPVGNVDTFDFIDIKSNPSNLQAAIQLANEKKMLWAKAKHAVGRDAKAKIYQRINFIDNFLFVNDNIEDSNHNLLQAKTIDFGYAMTVHKSQGSTFTNVLMDDVDISRAGLNSNNAMEVVDLGEVDNNVASSANFTGDAEDVDLGFSNDFSTTPTEPTEHTAPTQTINLKQQLEYVGVSRATDTVTIVSNHVKKEGSPLHKDSTAKENNLRSNNKTENNESNNTRNAETVAGKQQTSNGGLLAESQARIQRGDGNLRETQEQGVLSQEDIDKPLNIDGSTPPTEPTTPTKEEPSTVSLPSYEYFNDLYEDTPVDAAWKIPYLKELDAQISGEKSIEDNKNIINRMDNILQATSEKEYLQELKNFEKKQVDKTLDEYDKLNRQIDNLLGNQDLESDGEIYHLDELGVAHLSASEIRHTAELVANEISDSISQLQKEEGLAEKQFPTLKTKLDFKSVSRKQIVETVGINRLIDKVKSIFDTEANWDSYQNAEDGGLQADLIFANWDAIMYLAADVFAMNEGFGIIKDFSNGNFTTTKNSNIDYDNFNDYSNDQDVVAEEGGKDEQEHWQIENRTIDVLNSMSALVRQGIHECYRLNADSSKVMSKWGIAERVNPREAVNSILRWTQGSLSLNDMIKKLSDKQSQNPWLSQLVQRLSDKSGSETDFQSQFYGVFSKHFQPYSIVLLEDGKYHSIAVNSHPALTDVMNTITSQFKIGEHPLFGTNGKVNTKLLGSANSISNDFTLHKALSELQNIDKSIKQGNTLDDKMSKVVSDNIMAVCRAFGYNITEDMLSGIVNAESITKVTSALNFIVKDLDSAVSAQHKGEMKDYNPFAFGTKFGINGSLRNFLTPITDKLEDTAVNAFYDSGKMYQSYVTPSFMTKLFNKFRQEGQAFEDFILNEYGSSEWFKFGAGDDDITKGWRNEWLRLLARDENARKVFDHKVELNFNKHNYMRNMSDAEYTLSLITEYFSESAKVEDQVPAWFRVPMQSNKPSSEFIKFYSYRGDGYKNAIVNGLHDMFLQEISRIQTVLRRNMSKDDSGFIKNFDTNGRKFCFLPVFNSYLEEGDASKRDILRNEDGSVSSDNNKFASLLQKKVNGETNLTPDEEVELGKLAERIIRQFMDNRVQSILDTWKSNGILEAAKNIKDIYPSEFDNSSNIKNEEREDVINDWVRKQVENFLWNDTFASKNILQLTLSDIAFYKDTEDLQKRLAQLHAPGVRGNINAIDYNGNRVSDGKYRTFILKDFDSFKSNIIANIAEVFDRKIAAAPDNQKAVMIALKESLVGKDGKYTKINVTDAQGYSSPSSYRKKAYIFGKWSRHAEDIYQKMLKGEYTYTDLETAFQPLKPFVYSKLTKDMGVDNAPIHSMQVPFQAKNAEYLLIMADAILKGEKLSRPNLLRAVYRVMEDSERLMPTKGIDTVQFESSIKSGLQGKMNIYQFRDMEGGEDAAYTFMMNQIFKEETDATGKRVYRNYNTDTFVHETSYEDYCLQQEVPEHFKEHSQAHGSQIRMITPSDLDLFTTDENGQQVDNFYEWTEPDGTHKRLKADEFRKEYEQTIADNIEESIDNLSAELHLNSEDKRERNIALSKILQREVLSSPRYGIDLVQACSIDKETGEFRIPKGDPIQAKRIEQLINSVIKNRVNKQKIAGGPIVQVSNFGTSKQLHIRFNDKQGNLIPLEEDYVPSEHKGLSYKDYLKKNQGGIAYFEVFCPIWSNELFDKFSNADGSINVDAVNAVDPELLKMVSYRIPTEDKYSCAPMKVVGFMPREAGDAIMLPYELTEIDDSDFDVDKRYVMRKDIPIKTKRRKDIESELFKKASESYAKAHNGKTNNQWIGEQIRMFLDNPQKMKSADKFMQWLYGQYQQVAYYTDAPTSGRMYRDNKIIDMTYAVLTNQMTADKILNPGGFDALKKMGYMVAAYKNPANKGISWNALQGMSIDELKKLSYTDKDLTFADTQIQFYKQNSAAALLIGVFAVNKVAHAILESNDIFLDVSEICGNDDFTIAGTTFGGRMQIDQKYDREGTLIGKTLGSLVSASADAVKDPILNLMNINMTTAGMLNTMLRLGMTFNDAALFLSQDVIERLLNQFNRENLSNYVSLDSLINKWLDEYRRKYNIDDSSNINTEPLSTEELVNGLTSEEHDATDYKVLLVFQKMRSLTDAMRKPTYATRFNSISSAVGPLIVDNLIIEHKMSQFIDANTDNGTHFYTADDVPVDIDDIFFDHPVLKQFARTVDIAKSLFSDMPAGSTGFRNLLAQLPKDIADKMYGDKKLLDQFSNFYQSYLLVQSGVINPKNLKDYATAFPKWFIEQNFKTKYPDNELIQAIRMNVAKSTGHPYLSINITGMDEQRKEELRSAWIDLHKVDPKLSKMLFDYSFFRAGIGFSPKTFMALVPTYVKERLKNENTGASYVDIYRHFPTVVPKLVINQFIRNNMNNNKLVPWKGGKDTHYNVNLKMGELKVYRPEEIADLTDVSYMKTKIGKETYYWHFDSSTSEELTFKRVKPLGNNGEYFEISTSEITNPLSEVSNVSEEKPASTVQESASDLKTESPQESIAEESVKTSIITKTEEVKNLSSLADLIMLQNPKLDHSGAEKLALTIKEKEKMFTKFLQKVFKQKGLDLNENEALDEFHKYC
jgi:exodeoxyribonuclease-5